MTPQWLFLRARVAVLVTVIFSCCSALGSSSASLHITAFDTSDAVVPGAQIQLLLNGKKVRSATSNDRGEVVFSNLVKGSYEVVASRQGLETITKDNVAVGEAKTASLALVFRIATVKQEVSVQATSESPVQQNASLGTEITSRRAKDIPGGPTTVLDALPLVPGVVRSTDGKIHISGSNEHHSGFIVNNADVTDPVTGEFEATVPIDSVETITVYKTPYLARYGGFTSGLVAVDTRRGGDKWRYDVNDPFPEFRVRSHHIVGLREITPRANLSGPLVANHLYFSEALEYLLRKQAVRALQFPFNETSQESFNSLTQLDYVVSSKHIMTLTFHGVPSTRKFVNLDFFNPQPVTPNYRSLTGTTSLMDHMTVRSGQLQSTLSFNQIDANVHPQGGAEMTITPTGNQGNYFSRQHREASRAEWRENFSLDPIRFAGTQNVQFGAAVGRTQFSAAIQDRPVDVLDTRGRLLRRIEFVNPGLIRQQDLEAAGFGQDHWIVNSKLAFDAGIRVEQQTMSRTLRFAPRLGFVFTPWTGRTVIRGGYGIFYDTVPLNVFSFNQFPEEIITTYDPGASANTTSYPRSKVHPKKKAPSVIRTVDEVQGRFAPSSAAWNIEIEHAIARSFQVRANYLENNSEGLFVVNREVAAGHPVLALRDNGHSFYRQLELGARYAWKGGQFSGSFVRSRAVGDLNEFDSFVGGFPLPIVPTNKFAHLPGDIPNRALLWGQFQLPFKMHVTPLVEFRNGFPYQVRNVLQNYIATRRDTRFPNYFSFDTKIAKDFRVKKHELEGSVSITNITNHFNPLAVHANRADPQFGKFFAYYDRRARVDLDVKF